MISPKNQARIDELGEERKECWGTGKDGDIKFVIEGIKEGAANERADFLG